MQRVFPEEFGYYFSKGDFEAIYETTVQSFQAQLDKSVFLSEAETFREGTEQFELVNHNQLEPGIKRYQWVDYHTSRMIVTAYNSGLEIIGIQFDVYENFPSDDIKTKNIYQLPFTGHWFVLWGGTDHFLNYHYPYSHQRYAFDFIRKENGMAHTGERDELTSYFAYNQPVTAPADGTVVRVLDGIHDNLPYQLNTEAPEGNAVIIEHPNNEYSLLAHLKKDSLKVTVGQTVNAGEMIAKCGNSGASDTPHLHFHVMNGIEPHESDSIRIQFQNGREPVQAEKVYGGSL